MLLPFIDEKKLLEHVKPLEDALEGEERERNEDGACHLLVHRMAQPELAELILSAPERKSREIPPAPPVSKLNELAATVLKVRFIYLSCAHGCVPRVLQL